MTAVIATFGEKVRMEADHYLSGTHGDQYTSTKIFKSIGGQLLIGYTGAPSICEKICKNFNPDLTTVKDEFDLARILDEYLVSIHSGLDEKYLGSYLIASKVGLFVASFWRGSWNCRLMVKPFAYIGALDSIKNVIDSKYNGVVTAPDMTGILLEVSKEDKTVQCFKNIPSVLEL